MSTLKYLQSNEFLLDVDSWRLFANLEELNKVSKKNQNLTEIRNQLAQKKETGNHPSLQIQYAHLELSSNN